MITPNTIKNNNKMTLIEKPQIKRLQTAMSKRFTSRDERLAFLSEFFSREITTTKELSKIEADEVLYFLNTGKTDFYGLFDKYNKQHMKVLSLVYQKQKTKPNVRHIRVASTEYLHNFLISKYSPVKKPLKSMNKKEVSKIIVALEGLVVHNFK